MKYLYLVVGAALGWYVFGLVLVLGADTGVLDLVGDGLIRFIFGDLQTQNIFADLLAVLFVFVFAVGGRLIGAILFGCLGYRLGKRLHEKDSDRRMSLSDEERRAFEKELKQAEAEGKEVWTRK